MFSSLKAFLVRRKMANAKSLSFENSISISCSEWEQEKDIDNMKRAIKDRLEKLLWDHAENIWNNYSHIVDIDSLNFFGKSFPEQDSKLIGYRFKTKQANIRTYQYIKSLFQKIESL